MSEQHDEVSEPVAQPAPPAASNGPDLAMLDRVEGELADVERVLPRLDDGTYGTCETCGAAVPDEQLATSPTARFCTEHSA